MHKKKTSNNYYEYVWPQTGYEWIINEVLKIKTMECNKENCSRHESGNKINKNIPNWGNWK